MRAFLISLLKSFLLKLSPPLNSNTEYERRVKEFARLFDEVRSNHISFTGVNTIYCGREPLVYGYDGDYVLISVKIPKVGAYFVLDHLVALDYSFSKEYSVSPDEYLRLRGVRAQIIEKFNQLTKSDGIKFILVPYDLPLTLEDVSSFVQEWLQNGR